MAFLVLLLFLVDWFFDRRGETRQLDPDGRDIMHGSGQVRSFS